jgi:PPOX class probable F420-dependent enzyme
MAKKRDQIKMSDEEIADFLAGQRVMNVCTIGRDGWPHVTALWYVVRDSEPWIYTYAKSQKVRNLERDDRATLLVEAGHEYQELRGVMLKSKAELHYDLETVAGVAEELFRRYQGERDATIDDATREALRAQAAKRVAVRFHPEEIASWDHSKLGGTY